MKSFTEAHQEQDIFIQAMKVLGLLPNQNGICLGRTRKGLEAIVIDQFDSFKNRLPNIKKLHDISLTLEEFKELEIFFSNTQLYSENIYYRYLFELPQKIKPQNFSLVSDMIMPLKLETLGGMRKVDVFLGSYTSQDLLSYFQSFAKVFQQHKPDIKHPIGFFLQSCNHCLAFGYRASKNQWENFINLNSIFSIPEVINISALSSSALTGFFSNTRVSFSTFIYAINGEAEIVKNIINEWHQADEWKEIQKITPEKLIYKDQFKHTLLSVGCQNGHFHEVCQLIEAHKQNQIPFPETGKGLLFLAVRHGHYKIVKALLEAGLNQSRFDINPLFVSVYFSYLKIAQLLLENGMNPNEETYPGVTLLEIAQSNGNVDMITLLSSKGATSSSNLNFDMESKYSSALLSAAQAGYHLIVDLLLKKGVQINDQVLLAAVRYNSPTTELVVNLLLNASNQNVSQKVFHQCCLIAIENGNLEVTKKILEKLEFTNKTQSLNFYLREAIKKGYNRIVNYLLELGANPIENGDDYAAFYCAAKFDTIFLTLYEYCINNKQAIKNVRIEGRAKQLMEEREKQYPFWNKNNLKSEQNISDQTSSCAKTFPNINGNNE